LRYGELFFYPKLAHIDISLKSLALQNSSLQAIVQCCVHDNMFRTLDT